MSRISYKEAFKNLIWNLTFIPSFRKKFERDIEQLNLDLVHDFRKPNELEPDIRENVLVLAESVVKFRRIIKESKQKALKEKVEKISFKLYQSHGSSKIIVTLRFYFVKDQFWKTNSIVLKDGFPQQKCPQKPLKFYPRKIKVVQRHLVDQGKVRVRHLKNQRSKYTLKGKQQTISFILMRSKSNKLVVALPNSKKI